MKNHKFTKFAIGVICASILFTGFHKENVAQAQEAVNQVTDAQQEQSYQYLSELDDVKNKTHIGYGNLIINGSTSGEKIHLRVDGEKIVLNKGIGAHATSTVVYDISKYSNKLTRFITYLGVDARRGDGGNGVKFTISVSDDGETWQELYQSKVLKGNQNAEFVDLDVKGKKYLKLYAHDNGNQAQDHAVYGDARLKTEDYNVGVENNTPFKTLREYDNIISQAKPEENLSNNLPMVYEREFVNRIGYYALQTLYENKEQKEAIEFLRTNRIAMSYFINGGPLVQGNGASADKSMIAFSKIYQKHKDKLKDGREDNFYLRLAISVASAYSYPENVRFWMTPNKEEDPVKRFETYLELSKENGVMDDAGSSGKNSTWSSKQFRELPIPLMRWVVDTRMNEDELKWLADYALETRKLGDPKKHFLDAYTYIEYKNSFGYADQKYYAPENHDKWNNKYKFDSYFQDYGKDIRRMWIVFEEGAVCGGLAKTYANLAEVFGRPSVVVGQPGHAATVTWEYSEKNKKYMWNIQNDISGWALSHSEYNNYLLGWGASKYSKDEPASYTVMASDAIAEYDKYIQANQYVLLANSYKENKQKESIYEKAIKIQKINVDAWEGLVSTKLDNESLKSTDYLEVAKRIMKELKYYPRAMEDLLRVIQPKITDPQEVAQFDMIRFNSLSDAEKATEKESTQPNICVAVAQNLLKKDTTRLASFSFDGKNAGKIMLDKKYDESSIQVRYSIDGGKHWTETKEHQIQLTEDEINQLTDKNDIKVGLVGLEANYTIDLVKGKSPKANNIYRNDWENLFVGSTDYLEYSTDAGKTWKDYQLKVKNEERFAGNVTVQLRYKNHATSIKSEADTYTFIENDDTPTRTYLPLNQVSLVSFSSEQNNTDQAAKNLIDGNANTVWHSKYNIKDNKEYVVEFKEPSYISELEYLPHSANGRWKTVEVYTSIDKDNWEKVAEVSLKNSDELKSIPLTCEKPAKYLKIKGLDSWGNTSGEEDKYFSGRMLNFYCDITKETLPLATVSYSTTDKTNQNVVATIQLPEGCQMVEGEASFLFEKNGMHTFKYQDKNHHLYEVVAKVDWIRKAQLQGSVTYSTTDPTYDNVVATIGNFEFDDVYVVNNNHSLTYTFTENGEFEFELADSYGNTGIVKAVVTNIDTIAPKAHIEYSITEWTNEDVIATLKADEGETYTILNNGGKDTYTFTQNGTFTFEIQDAAKNKAKIIATVDWIDKAKDEIKAQYSVQDKPSDPITVTLQVHPKKHEIVNNDGLNTYTFTENGTFIFQIRLLDSGKIVEYEVKVDSILVPEPSPDLEPEVKPDPDESPNLEPEVKPDSEQNHIPEVKPTPQTPSASDQEQDKLQGQVQPSKEQEISIKSPKTGDEIKLLIPLMGLSISLVAIFVTMKRKKI
ncbi:NPCBM/NEW2 domain-containing protein [Faecalimonas sp.]